MAVNLSMLAGAGAQFFDNNGNPLVGGRIFTYAAGTTTPQATFTTNLGNVAHPNPIILDAAGRVPSGGEIWLTEGVFYKFTVETSTLVTIGTYDNISGSESGVLARIAQPDGSSLIGFTGTGLAITTRTTEDKLREIASRNDYSTDGDYDTARNALTGRNDLVVRPSSDVGDSLLSNVLGNLNTSVDNIKITQSRPAFLEQHISGFFGRGMLTAEVINVTTEQFLTASASAGATVLALTSVANFVIGGCISVKHDNGLYGTYFINSISGSNVGIFPSLRYSCTVANSKVERTWYNRAHPGKFYMRELAQRIARTIELDAAMPNGGRVLFTNLSSNPTNTEDSLTVIGTAALFYFSASNLGTAGVASPVRFTMGRSAYVESITAIGHGVETQLFDTLGVASAVAKVMFYAEGANRVYAIEVIDDEGVQRAKYVTTSVADQGVMRIYTIPADLRGANKIKVRITAETYTGSGGFFTIGQIDVFEAPPAATKVINPPSAKIVCLGDSWIAGDLISTPEREPITQQLALELPNATIINAGVGGNKIWEELSRFDTDVAVHNPDYVVINTGTNESYNPVSAVFDPNSIDFFLLQYSLLLNKIAAIGARAVIIGVPALSQTDAETPSLAEWELNDRARSYARYFFEWQSKKPFVTSGSNSNGQWTKFEDGTLICRHTISVTTPAANTIGISLWTYPVPFTTTPKVTVSLSSYSTGQVVATGTDGATSQDVSVRMFTNVSGITLPIDCHAIGRWR